MRTLLLFSGLFFFNSLNAQTQTCAINFSYDASGNRIKRQYDCWTSTPGGGGSTGRLTGTTIQPNTLSIYPNPVEELLSIQLEHPLEKAQIQVLNLKGEIVKQSSITGTRASLEVQDLAKGMYMICIQTASELLTEPFIKQ
jgi:hypothetical protein